MSHLSSKITQQCRGKRQCFGHVAHDRAKRREYSDSLLSRNLTRPVRKDVEAAVLESFGSEEQFHGGNDSELR